MSNGFEVIGLTGIKPNRLLDFKVYVALSYSNSHINIEVDDDGKVKAIKFPLTTQYDIKNKKRLKNEEPSHYWKKWGLESGQSMDIREQIKEDILAQNIFNHALQNRNNSGQEYKGGYKNADYVIASRQRYWRKKAKEGKSPVQKIKMGVHTGVRIYRPNIQFLPDGQKGKNVLLDMFDFIDLAMMINKGKKLEEINIDGKIKAMYGYINDIDVPSCKCGEYFKTWPQLYGHFTHCTDRGL